MTGCSVQRSALAYLAAGGLGEAKARVLQAHVASCAHCTRRLQAIRAGLDALRDREPPIASDLEQRRHILAAVQHTPAEVHRGVRWWIPLAGVGLAAAAGIALWLARSPAAPEPTAGHTIVQLDDGVLDVRDGAVYELDRDRHTIAISHGRIRVVITANPQRPVTVTTTAAIARVVSSVFEVAADVHATTIAVERGTIELRSVADPTTRTVQAGEIVIAVVTNDVTAAATPPPLPSSPPSAPATPPDDVAAATPTEQDRPPDPDDPVASKVTAPPPISKIRSRIQAGELAAASVLLERAKAYGRPIDAAELAIVDAELKLAKGQYAAAIAAYLKVVKRFPHTGQSEAALFAAAQLALDHPDAGRDGTTLLRQYLTSYPRGRLHEQGERMLRALEAQPR